MSPDNQFLSRNWTNIKLATQFIIDQDKNRDGMVDTPLENNLDAIWDGEIAWIVGLCIAAVKAARMMAHEVGDAEFESKCRKFAANGSRNMDAKLFNGEYYIHRPDAIQGKKNWVHTTPAISTRCMDKAGHSRLDSAASWIKRKLCRH